LGNFQPEQKNESNLWKEHAGTISNNHVQESIGCGAISLVPEPFNFLMDGQKKIKLRHRFQQAKEIESFGVLSNGIVHDFNNILHPIIVTLEILMEEAAENRELKMSLKNVLAGAKRAGSLARQILSPGQKADFKVCLVKIQPIIREVLNLSRSTLPINMKIIRAIDDECGPVMADPIHIYQIVMNLVTNALHSMGNDKGFLTVTLKDFEVTCDVPGGITLKPGTYACLSVGDTGKGIDMTLKNKIFEPYFTTKEKGTGLGLSNISNIVKNYDGDICFSSKPGKGSLFQVYLPRRHVTFNTTQVNKDKQNNLSENESILLVDDDPLIVEIQQMTFERCGYNVTPFVSSLDALDEFKSRPEFFDIVICDMTMPDMTGIVLAEKIKQIRSDIPVIICTGFSEQINKDNYHDKGIDGFLMKPFKKEESLGLIRHLLGNG